MSRKFRKNIQDLTQRSLITHNNPKSPISEQYRTIRTNIQFASIDKDFKKLMVTSSGPGEGKSTTAANLAVVLAQQGKRVLLVDGDLRKPTVHYTFKVSNIYGVTNVLTRQTALKDAVVSTKIPDLDVLPSGPVPPNPSELINSKSMDNLIEEASVMYDYVLFDTPPVLAVTDGQLLSHKVDGVILVVSSGKTEIDAAVKAKELLVHAQANIIGTVLNGKEIQNDNYYYYYGKN
ncbi:CpsD/CapB family tyrosine-protein kinase [Fictibacillus barbaricus]|uniref:non-specific protein-tyrosine kinase n=1 Tax=Fictibacillus barbaricus TaxID=182136 RepID=A0ABU1U1I7_9BACL|nr:CpsD/CapB family tyrosine-protein kinase [Fictibacillus barbaricus]MDR7073329.1 capsular exopolysaccharide synthesis family protein [Fictibacillus barbaricus]